MQLYNALKIETVGNRYMIVSGMPYSNEQHALTVGRIALELLSQIQKFTRIDNPEERICIKLGIHSGSVVAGVLGLTLPRYCLIGDTVNTSSQLEVSGKANKIHVSEEFKNRIELLAKCDILKRSSIDILGTFEVSVQK